MRGLPPDGRLHLAHTEDELKAAGKALETRLNNRLQKGPCGSLSFFDWYRVYTEKVLPMHSGDAMMRTEDNKEHRTPLQADGSIHD